MSPDVLVHEIDSAVRQPDIVQGRCPPRARGSPRRIVPLEQRSHNFAVPLRFRVPLLWRGDGE